VVQPARRAPFSYRDDPAVPAFDDRGPVAFMDGECALCTTGARLVARLDRKGEFRICPTQTALGRAVLAHYHLDPDDPASWLYLVDGAAYGSLDGIIRAGRRLGGVGHLLVALRLLPPPLQNWLYARVARNRIRWFGRATMCERPGPELARRLLE
jgi:predicted DCC family thiol-disulfide oxidoreductase YuxK